MKKRRVRLFRQDIRQEIEGEKKVNFPLTKNKQKFTANIIGKEKIEYAPANKYISIRSIYSRT